ncbi:fructose-1,6-bisphosphate aldolase, class II [candidate division LCP-89 bacterium B3_LCP]|uniref:Fructose-1,6-bisphosphate aldolase, class II n=1 Tax=candidate division LCP-89 bacterium B3_LCP TaxID=2012998 RepID=A0A532UYU8_UNCL8|nr:MAG: fructose-1,6-bisphosphate aldolase, class II [candidate division LCP-89 bacterium B3_LCP]
MPLVPLHEMYQDAVANRYAIGQFNVSNLEFVQAVLEAAEEMNSPAIIAASSSAIKYAGLENLVAIVRTAVGNLDVPIALHLDHGADVEIVRQCVDAGFTSVMIDGSQHPLEENIHLTQEVVDYAHMFNVTVEAELGRLSGMEDEVKVEAKDSCYTDPDEAVKFVQESGCDALAIAVGTSHGAHKFKGEAKLDFDRIETIKQMTGIPLVLHGASGVPEDLISKISQYGGDIPGAKGVPDEAYHQAIDRGINKINIDTDLRLAFTAAIRELLSSDPGVFDPRKILGYARQAVKTIIKGKMEVLGSANRVSVEGVETEPYSITSSS